jgi:hypothetical protein
MTSFASRSILGMIAFCGAGLIALARCSSASAPPAYACPTILKSGPGLLYPIPNSTSVPIVAGNLIFSNAPPSGLGSFLLRDGTIVAVTSTFAPAPSPLPSPYATPLFSSSPSPVAAPYPKLAPGATYSVTFATSSGPFAAPCGSGYEFYFFTTATS